MNFGPKDDEERVIFERENFLQDFEIAITDAFHFNPSNYTEDVKRKLKELFSPDNDPTLRDISSFLSFASVEASVGNTDDGQGIEITLLFKKE